MKIPNLTLNNGLKIPILGFGTWQLKGEECMNAVKNAIELGYRHIDTAEAYYNESQIGEAIKQSKINREELFITSKVWSPINLSYKKVLKSFEKSIEKLKTDYLDLYLIHWPNRRADIKEVLRAFKELYSQGRIKSIGVSNFTINHLRDIIPVAEEMGIKISVNQVEFHPLLFQKELLNFCSEKNIILTAYSPLARGKVFENSVINSIAKKCKKTSGQIALRWIIDKKIIAIPKAASKEHIKENMNIFDFKLEKEDTEKLDNINENKRLINPPFIADFDY